jgi:hypothetical protein
MSGDLGDQALRVEAARRLGGRMDRGFDAFTRIPSAVWITVFLTISLINLASGTRQKSLLGLPLENWLERWLARMGVTGILIGGLAVVAFVLRTIVTLLERDQWPRKVAGVEIESVRGAHAQLLHDADQLSSAAEDTAKLHAELRQARDAILLLNGELSRLREEPSSDARRDPQEEDSGQTSV